MPILRAEHIYKIFGPHPQEALQMAQQGKTRQEIQDQTGHTLGVADVSFEVEQGEIVVVMGLSGSGKSTLVRCLNRLMEPTAGRVFIEDDEVTQMGRRELLHLRRHKAGMVFQQFALFPHRTVVDNVAYGLEITGEMNKKQRREKAMKAIELVGLKGWADQLPSSLSGGMQQRVGLARALAADPKIILMDEALSALDPLIRKDMQNELIELQRNLNTTIVFITHDLDEAIHLGDRIVLMKDGWVVQQGTAEEILTNPANRYVERFVEDVDMTEIMSAQTVMRKVRQVAFPSDGPRTVLTKMREAGLSNMFVVDTNWKLKGIANAEHVAKLTQQPEHERKGAAWYSSEPKRISPETPLSSIVPMMAESHEPVAVVDEKDRLKGVIVLGALLGGLAEGVKQR